MGTDQAVVCGYDGSDGATAALEWAAQEARLRGGALRIVMGLNWPEGVRVPGEQVTYLPSDRDGLRLGQQAVDEAAEAVRERRRRVALLAVNAVHLDPVAESVGLVPVFQDVRSALEAESTQLLDEALEPWRTKQPSVDIASTTVSDTPWPPSRPQQEEQCCSWGAAEGAAGSRRCCSAR